MEHDTQQSPLNPPWRVLIVDDDHEVHLVTRMVLKKTRFMGRVVSLESAYSAAEAREILTADGDSVACILLDVVMEDQDAGLELTRWIREELGNRSVRIILRTGMPGSAPEERIILEYDINDYREKADLSALKLRTSVFAALRSWADLKRVENQGLEIRQGWEFLGNLVDSMPSLIAVVDSGNRILLWNKSAAELTGIGIDGAKGAEIFSLLPELIPLRQEFAEVRSGTIPWTELRLTLSRKNKALRMYIIVYPLIMNGKAALLLRGDDISLQEEREVRLRRAQILEAMGSLASGFAHDLNNILGGIIGALSLIDCEREEAPERHNSAYDTYIETIRDSSTRASGLVRQLLTLTRRGEDKEEPVALKELIDRVRRMCRSSFDSRIELDIPPVPGEAVVTGDATRFEQMLYNLCINAYHAMTSMRGDGQMPGGTLSIRVIREETVPKREWWSIVVEDDGIGIDADVRERIFDPYFTTRETTGGEGLGLALVHSVAEQYNGEIDLHSEPGKGTRVVVRFPVLPGEGEDSGKDEDDDGATAGSILVCDDEELMREVAGRILERGGYTVFYAADGNEACAVYRENREKIDLIVLDLSMPRESGLDVFRRLKEIDGSVPVLFSSGYQDDERLNTALDEGAAGFLQKPYTMNKMLRKVRRCIAERG
jgi:PAS domain S-box-containing protein